ncbi:MAG: hypothetical protein HYU97_03950 [Deltaproteobacteria bacterium]|nr:hypothetical protein [Deltaproteobacteria bacterium]
MTVKIKVQAPPPGDAPNYPPFIVFPTHDLIANEHSTFVFKVWAIDNEDYPNVVDDPMGHGALTFWAENLPPGALFNPDTQVFTWTPATEQPALGVKFVVQDSGGLTDSETIDIHVNPVIFDGDGDGFKEDVDCDDSTAIIRPLHAGQVNHINSHTIICEGNYDDTSIIVSGQNFTVESTADGDAVFYGVGLRGAGAFFGFENAHNITVREIWLIDAGVADLPGGWFYACLYFANSSNNDLEHMVVDCGASGIGGEFAAAFEEDSDFNHLSSMSFTIGEEEGNSIFFHSTTNNNTIEECNMNGEVINQGGNTNVVNCIQQN